MTTSEKKQSQRRASDKWRKKNKGHVKQYARKYNLKKNFGLTTEDFDRMLAAQGGGCAICDKRTIRMAVDHDHKTGKIRGILCVNCNPGLGKFLDCPNLLLRASQYLRRHSAPVADETFTGDAGC